MSEMIKLGCAVVPVEDIKVKYHQSLANEAASIKRDRGSNILSLSYAEEEDDSMILSTVDDLTLKVPLSLIGEKVSGGNNAIVLLTLARVLSVLKQEFCQGGGPELQIDVVMPEVDTTFNREIGDVCDHVKGSMNIVLSQDKFLLVRKSWHLPIEGQTDTLMCGESHSVALRFMENPLADLKDRVETLLVPTYFSDSGISQICLPTTSELGVLRVALGENSPVDIDDLALSVNCDEARIMGLIARGQELDPLNDSANFFVSQIARCVRNRNPFGFLGRYATREGVNKHTLKYFQGESPQDIIATQIMCTNFNIQAQILEGLEGNLEELDCRMEHTAFTAGAGDNNTTGALLYPWIREIPGVKDEKQAAEIATELGALLAVIIHRSPYTNFAKASDELLRKVLKLAIDRVQTGESNVLSEHFTHGKPGAESLCLAVTTP